MIRPCVAGEEGALEAFLAAHSATSMFLRGNLAAHGLVPKDHPHATRFWRWPEGGAIKAVLGLTRAGMVLCQCPDPRALDAFLPVLQGTALSGFTGEAAQTGALIAALGLADDDFRLNHVEPLFRLDLAALADPGASIRPARPADVPLLEGWFATYMAETGLGAGDPAAGIAEARDRAAAALVPDSPVRLLDQGGEPLAMASLNARAGASVQVGGVYVPKGQRNRGLGRRVTAALLAEARSAGASEAVLFANNDAAAAAYRALGFAQVGQYRIAFLANPRILEARPCA